MIAIVATAGTATLVAAVARAIAIEIKNATRLTYSRGTSTSHVETSAGRFGSARFVYEIRVLMHFRVEGALIVHMDDFPLDTHQWEGFDTPATTAVNVETHGAAAGGPSL